MGNLLLSHTADEKHAKQNYHVFHHLSAKAERTDHNTPSRLNNRSITAFFLLSTTFILLFGEGFIQTKWHHHVIFHKKQKAIRIAKPLP